MNTIKAGLLVILAVSIGGANANEPVTLEGVAKEFRDAVFPNGKVQVLGDDWHVANYRPTVRIVVPADDAQPSKSPKPASPLEKKREALRAQNKRAKLSVKEGANGDTGLSALFTGGARMNYENCVFITTFIDEPQAAQFANSKNGIQTLSPGLKLAAFPKGAAVIWGDKKLIDRIERK